jgi:hypothetical protein
MDRFEPSATVAKLRAQLGHPVVDSDDLRDFLSANPVGLRAATNPQFFDGSVEQAASALTA